MCFVDVVSRKKLILLYCVSWSMILGESLGVAPNLRYVLVLRGIFPHPFFQN